MKELFTLIITSIKAVTKGIFKFYQFFLSPLLGNCCRFHPSCSNYALEVLQKYSLPKAYAKIIWRLLRCNPLCKGGIDKA